MYIQAASALVVHGVYGRLSALLEAFSPAPSCTPTSAATAVYNKTDSFLAYSTVPGSKEGGVGGGGAAGAEDVREGVLACQAAQTCEPLPMMEALALEARLRDQVSGRKVML